MTQHDQIVQEVKDTFPDQPDHRARVFLWLAREQEAAIHVTRKSFWYGVALGAVLSLLTRILLVWGLT